jgi:dienelactone hydrolase
MKAVVFAILFVVPILTFSQTKVNKLTDSNKAVNEIAPAFKALLQRPRVDFNPSFQSITTDSVIIEKGFIYSEATEKVPVLIYKPAPSNLQTFPVVICLHGTGGSKDEETIRNLLYRFSKIGIMGIAIDARYHGERIAGGAHKAEEYVEAIRKAWENKDTSHPEYPFYYDTVYDLWRLIDYLVTRSDVQANRIGMMGISMGGIETWMAASVDQRIKVAVPVIAAQSFRWSLENNSWQGRAKTIWKAHEQAAKDLGDSTVNKENVQRLWAKLLPGITDKFDCPSMIRFFAPRPLLLLSNEKDLNCPLPGAELAFKAATEAYRSKRALDKLKIHVTPNEPHRFLPHHAEMTIAWFKKWL